MGRLTRFRTSLIAVPVIVGTVGTLLGFGVLTGSAGAASAALPKITVTMNGSSISVHGALKSGAVDVVLKTTNEQQGNAILVRLNRGVSSARVLRYVKAHTNLDPNRISRFGAIDFHAA